MKTLTYHSQPLVDHIANGGDHGEFAHAMVLALDETLGPQINLINRDGEAPNVVNGHVNTCSDGTVEIVLYDDEDAHVLDERLPLIQAAPAMALQVIQEHIEAN